MLSHLLPPEARGKSQAHLQLPVKPSQRVLMALLRGQRCPLGAVIHLPRVYGSFTTAPWQLMAAPAGTAQPLSAGRVCPPPAGITLLAHSCPWVLPPNCICVGSPGWAPSWGLQGRQLRGSFGFSHHYMQQDGVKEGLCLQFGVRILLRTKDTVVDRRRRPWPHGVSV